MNIIICNTIYLPLYQVFGNILYFTRRHPGIDYTGFYPGTFKHHGACSDDGVAVNLRVIHDNGAHAYQYIIMQRTTMYDSIVPDGNIIANGGFCFLVRAMYDRAILYVHFITDPDAVHIAAYNCIEPYAAIIAHNNGMVMP